MIVNHIAIQTSDLAKTKAWYERVFGAHQTWELDKFNPTTKRRLPGIRKLVELRAQSVTFHIFDREGVPEVKGTTVDHSFNHVCIEVDSLARLEAFRAHVIAMQGGHALSNGELSSPTEIEWDETKSASLYFLDVNGLEIEMTWVAKAEVASSPPLNVAMSSEGRIG